MFRSRFSVWFVLFLFLGVMGLVATTAFLRQSNATGIDPATIQALRASS